MAKDPRTRRLKTDLMWRSSLGSRGAAFLYLEALNLQAMATPAGAGRGGCQRREVLGMCAARRQNSVTQLLLPGLPVLLCTHRASGTTSRSLPSLLVSKAHCCEKAGRLTAGIRSIPGVCCPAAELALPAGGSVGGSPHLASTSALPAPAPAPPLGHSDDVRSGSAGLTSLPPPQPR